MGDERGASIRLEPNEHGTLVAHLSYSRGSAEAEISITPAPDWILGMVDDIEEVVAEHGATPGDSLSDVGPLLTLIDGGADDDT